MIRPPESVRALIFKTAAFLKTTASPEQFSDKLLTQDSVKFGFLSKDHFYNPFFQGVFDGEIIEELKEITEKNDKDRIEEEEKRKREQEALDEEIEIFFSESNSLNRAKLYVDQFESQNGYLSQDLLNKFKYLADMKKRKKFHASQNPNDQPDIILDYKVFTRLPFKHEFLDFRGLRDVLDGETFEFSEYIRDIRKGTHISDLELKQKHLHQQETHIHQSSSQQDTQKSLNQFIRDPITGALIEKDKFESHLKGLLLDPQYKKDKESMLKRVQENEKVYSKEVVGLLKKFTSSLDEK
jgi:Pre-mRNA splicing factor PRP21 like protein